MTYFCAVDSLFYLADQGQPREMGSKCFIEKSSSCLFKKVMVKLLLNKLGKWFIEAQDSVFQGLLVNEKWKVKQKYEGYSDF